MGQLSLTRKTELLENHMDNNFFCVVGGKYFAGGLKLPTESSER